MRNSHRVAKKDQARIQCSDIYNVTLTECTQPATICLYSRFTRNGGSRGIAFYYYCAEHAKAAKARS